MNEERKIDLITERTEEVVKEEELKKLFQEKDQPTAYLGFAPTGKLHIAHFAYPLKISDFLEAGFEFKFLIADLHAFMDSQKTPWDLLDSRAEYYERCIKAMLKAVGEKRKIEFIRGSDYQESEKYVMDLFRLLGETTVNRARRAASEVVRFEENPKLGGFVYPLMQVNDVKALDADVALGGIDQRGIYMLSRETLPDIDYRKPISVFMPLLPGLSGKKMSASDKKSKISLPATEKEIEEKIKEAYCPAGNPRNVLVQFTRDVLLPVNKEINVYRPDKYGGDKKYTSFQELGKDFEKEDLHPLDLKKAIARQVNELSEPVRKEFEGEEDLLKQAYPE